MPQRSFRLSQLIILLVIIGTGLLLYSKRLALYDWYRLRNYQPPAAISQLATDTTMTAYGRHLFYVYHPALESSSQFNSHCHVTPQAIVLGCTVYGQGIYLYDVQDSDLNGVQQVTAAYEMLHVGYERLSPRKRAHIDQLVMQAFTTASATDSRLKDEEQSYLNTEGQGAVANELHSMMGTEVANLSPELSAYYAQYFSNRQAIIAFKNQYQSAFTQRQATVSQDDKQLAALKQQINNLDASLNQQQTALANQRAQLDAELAAKQYDTYNAAVPGFNSLVEAYNADVAQEKILINQYNSLLDKRNAIAIEEQQLYQALNSQATPQTTR